MIPYRAPPAPTRTESIPDRLARLRSEQRSASSSANRRCAPGTRSSSSWPASASALANSFGAEWDTRATRARERNASQTTLAAGPPAPPSWGPQVGRGSGPRGSSQSGPSSSRTAKAPPLVSARREAIVAAQLHRKQILQPLFPSTHPPLVSDPPTVPSLLLTCAHLIAAVLVDPPQRHLVLPFLPILPDHLRLNLFDWTTTTGYALEERAIYQLLLPYHDNGEEEEEESATYNESSTSSDEWDDYSDSDEDPPPGGYLTPLRRSLSSPRFPYQSLTSLNLAFSPLKLPFLRSLLLSPRSIPLFPHLSHLNLAVTPNLYFVEAFFKLLSSLISLRSLSLAGKSLYPPLHLEEEEEEDDALTRAHLEGFLLNRLASAPRFLPRLVEATPTLQSLDLSYIPDLNINALHGIAWDRQWLDLVKLGVKTYPARTTSIELERERKLNELGFVVKRRGEKTRKRLWLDVYY